MCELSSSDSATAAPACATAKSSAGAVFRLLVADAEAVKAKLEEMRALRHEAQPQGIRTFGSTFKNPEDPRAEGRSAGMLLSLAGCNGLQVGQARFASKHANFVENLGAARYR